MSIIWYVRNINLMKTGIGQWKYYIPQPFSRCLISLCSSLFYFNSINTWEIRGSVFFSSIWILQCVLRIQPCKLASFNLSWAAGWSKQDKFRLRSQTFSKDQNHRSLDLMGSIGWYRVNPDWKPYKVYITHYSPNVMILELLSRRKKNWRAPFMGRTYRRAEL